MARERRTDPLAAPVAALCRDGETLLGAWPLAELPRLAGSLFVAPAAAEHVSWQARFGQELPVGRPPQPWLELEAHAHVTLQCQRCLQALPQALALQRRFRFVASEDEAERLDAESDDEHLVLLPRLDLRALLEDELILELPLVPRHDGSCPEPLPLTAAPPPVPEARPNPFAALAALRNGGKAGDAG
jgi:uncharacterized protein